MHQPSANHLTGSPEFGRLEEAYRDRPVLVLGGDGFLGFHTTRALTRLGARVSVLTRRRESLHSPHDCRIIHADLNDEVALRKALRGQEVIFDLAGSSGGVDSNRDPFGNLIADCAPHLKAFQSAAEQDTPPHIVFCSTRTVYGRPRTLPVAEDHPLAPLSMYAAHKATLENHLAILHQTHGLRYTVFRLSNPYGPFPAVSRKSYGVINQFIHKALKNEPIMIYGDGSQLRDYIYVDDVVGSFLHSAVTPSCEQEIFNLGGPHPITIREAAETLREFHPDLRIEFGDWPGDYQTVETGDYLTDLTKLRERIGPVVRTSFRDGLQATLRSDLRTRKPTPTAARSRALTRASDARFWEGKHVLVTGAGGFLGSHLAKRLSQRGAQVGAVIYRRTLSPWLVDDPRIFPLPMDLTEPREKILSLFEHFKPDYVYHFASDPDGPEEEERIFRRLECNLTATINLLAAASRHSVRGFILGDSCKVYGNAQVPHREHSLTRPDSSYAASKLAAWHFCQVYMNAFRLPVAALRPTLIYGPGEAFNLFGYLSRCLGNGDPQITLQGGRQTRDPLFIDDAIQAYLLAAERMDRVAGRAIPIGGGQEQPVLELARSFIAQWGESTPVQACPDNLRSGDMMRSYCDNSEALELLGWAPAVERESGLRQTARFHQAIAKGAGHEFLTHWFQHDKDDMISSRLDSVTGQA